MERWRTADPYDQPWHGIEAVYVKAQNNGMEQSRDNGGEMKDDDLNSMSAMDGSNCTLAKNEAGDLWTSLLSRGIDLDDGLFEVSVQLFLK